MIKETDCMSLISLIRGLDLNIYQRTDARQELDSLFKELGRKYYLIDTTDTEIDYINCSDSEFMKESQRQNLVFPQYGFISAFNSEEISTVTHQLRVL